MLYSKSKLITFLNILKNYKMNAKQIDVEGLTLPNIALSNIQLIEAAKKLNINNFRDVFLRDELPKKPRAIECGILNLDDSSGRGSHWTCWIKRAKDKTYFDSYGLPPPTELVKYLKSPVYYNSCLLYTSDAADERSS